MKVNNIIDTIITGIEVEKVFLNPIENHLIKDKPGDILEQYFVILLIISSYKTELNKNQKLFLEKLVIASNNNDSLEYYYKKVNNIDNDFIHVFVKNFKTNDLKYALAIDMFIILGLSDDVLDDQINLASEILSILNIKIPETKLLTSISKAVLEQDSDRITPLIQVSDNLLEYAVCYLTNFYKGPICITPELIYCINTDKQKISFSKLKKYLEVEDDIGTLQIFFENDIETKLKDKVNFTANKIIIEGYEICKENILLSIETCKKLEFINGIFNDIDLSPIQIKNCDEAIFTNCEFVNINHPIIKVVDTYKLTLNNCKIENCNTASMFNLNNLNNLEIYNTSFNRITFKQLTESIITVNVWPNVLKIINCEFNKCKNMSAYGALLLSSNEEPDYKTSISINNNTFTDCFASMIIKYPNIDDKLYLNNKVNNETKLT